MSVCSLMMQVYAILLGLVIQEMTLRFGCQMAEFSICHPLGLWHMMLSGIFSNIGTHNQLKEP